MEIRDASETDFETIVALNGAEEQQTSHMDGERMRALHGLSTYHRVAVAEGRVVGFLLAMGESVPYENDNYAWFVSRYPRFVYVDRVVVAREFGGRGIGSALYRDLFERARRGDVAMVVCEYNLDPPNAASRAFHERFGFREVGRQRVAGGAKLVSLQAADV